MAIGIYLHEGEKSKTRLLGEIAGKFKNGVGEVIGNVTATISNLSSASQRVDAMANRQSHRGNH